MCFQFNNVHFVHRKMIENVKNHLKYFNIHFDIWYIVTEICLFESQYVNRTVHICTSHQTILMLFLIQDINAYIRFISNELTFPSNLISSFFVYLLNISNSLSFSLSLFSFCLFNVRFALKIALIKSDAVLLSVYRNVDNFSLRIWVLT